MLLIMKACCCCSFCYYYCTSLSHKSVRYLVLFQLFLRTELGGVPALLLAAVDSLRWESSVAFAADHLVAVVLLREQRQRGIVHAATEPQHKVQRRFLLDVVIAERSTVLQLLPSENQPLLIRRNPLLVLNFRLHVVNRVRRFHIQSNRFARQSFHKNLHVDTITIKLLLFVDVLDSLCTTH